MSNFWPLINCKIHLDVNWTRNCVISDNNCNTTFEITNTKLHVPIFTLSTEEFGFK